MPVTDLKALHGFPYLELLVAAAIAIGAIIMIYRGVRDARRALPTDPSTLYFDGPLKAALRGLERIATAVEHSPTHVLEWQKFRDDIGTRVSETKRLLFLEIDKRCREEKAERDELEKRVHNVELQIARMTGPGRRR